MHTIKLICVLAGAVIALAGCGSSDEATPTTDTTTTETVTTEPPATETAATETTTTETTEPAPPAPTTVRITVRDGRPVGGIARPSVGQGERVVLVVRSNVADHVHVHGYDLFADVAPGASARLAFRATIPGRFEIELEDSHVQIAELTVQP